MFKRLFLLSAITVHSLSWSGMETNNHVACKAINFLSNLTSLFEGKAFNVSSSVANLNKALSKSSRVHTQLGTSASQSTVKIGGYAIGEFAQGGVVIWVTDDKQHGLVASINNLGPATGPNPYVLAWGPDNQTTSATSDNPLPTVYTNPIPKNNYSGYQNQLKIQALDQSFSDYPAFKACAEYSIKINGITYGDWFLPSLTELIEMSTNFDLVNKVSIANRGEALFSNPTDPYYWSSLEGPVPASDNSAWCFIFYDDGDQPYNLNQKNVSYAVRCVRAF